MTWAEFKEKFLSRIGEVGTGFFDDETLEDFIESAILKIIEPKVEQFGVSKKITREMQIVIDTASNVAIANGIVDISPDSSVIPNFYSEIQIDITSPYLDRTLTRTATIRNKNEGISPYSSGTAEYPNYEIAGGELLIQPDDATSLTIQYFVAPVAPDLSDNTQPIPYNPKLIDLILDETMVLAGVEDRDQWIEQKSTEQVVRNP